MLDGRTVEIKGKLILTNFSMEYKFTILYVSLILYYIYLFIQLFEFVRPSDALFLCNGQFIVPNWHHACISTNLCIAQHYPIHTIHQIFIVTEGTLITFYYFLKYELKHSGFNSEISR